MLVSLHIRNMALIREAEVEFGPGLNILTGETGAGKSIIIGSVEAALGAASFRDLAPDAAEGEAGAPSLAELVFETDREEVLGWLAEHDIPCEEGQIILSRKYSGGRTINRINGETVTVSQIRRLSGMLIDIHGQHEHQSLLKPSAHRALLDRYASEELGDLPARCRTLYHAWKEAVRARDGAQMDEADRLKQIDLLQYEMNEIEDAALAPGEDEQLEADFLAMSHGQKILDALSETEQMTGSGEGASDLISRAARTLSSVTQYDPRLEDLSAQLADLEGLCVDFEHALRDYMDGFAYDEETFRETGTRLDEINRLKLKYGKTIPDILGALEERKQKLQELTDYEEYRRRLEEGCRKAEADLRDCARKISAIRREKAAVLEKQITEALEDLNFPRVRFCISFAETAEPTETGTDEVCFMISMNPGMPVRPLQDVASGGELSRIMLAVKAVMADQDEIGTLIFDEIDTGISGRTAQKVSEKMAVIAGKHQVICITHLAQIAAMADRHFVIEKEVTASSTRTVIRPLASGEETEELARILGGASITDAVRSNAEEMRRLALDQKEKIQKQA